MQISKIRTLPGLCCRGTLRLDAEPITQDILVVEPPEIHDAPVFDPVVNPTLPDAPPVTDHTGIDQAQNKTMPAAFTW